jgi:hypothetical protein
MTKQTIEYRLSAIESRNKRVEQDKAWETSWTRRLSISAITYISVVTYLFVIKNSSPFINGLVPVIGYLLSTIALPVIRKIWSKQRKKL